MNSWKWNDAIREFLKALADLGHSQDLTKMLDHDFMKRDEALYSEFMADLIINYTQKGLLDGAPFSDLKEIV